MLEIHRFAFKYLSLNILLLCFFHRLLDRDQVGDEEASLDDEDEDGFLKAFKVLSSIINICMLICDSFLLIDVRYDFSSSIEKVI